MVDDRRLDDHARLELLLHRAPLALEAGAAQREDRVALLRLGLEDVHEDDVADGQLRLALGMAAVELAVADDAFGLGADVDEDLVLVDPDDGALDDVAVLEALDVRVLLGEELLHRRRLGAEVADGAGSGSSSSPAAGASAVSSSLRASVGLCRHRSRRQRLASVRRLSPGASVGASAGASRWLPRSRRAGGLGGVRARGLCDRGRGSADRRRLDLGLRPTRPAPRSTQWPRHHRLTQRPWPSLGGGRCGGWGLLRGVGRPRRWRARLRRRPPRGPLGRLLRVRGNRLRLRRGPALLFFGQLSCLSCSVDVPEIQRGLGSAQAVVRNDEMTVRGDWAAVLSLRGEAGVDDLQLCCLPEPGESSTRFLAATIGRPCPNCPISPLSPRHSTLPSSAVRSRPWPPLDPSPCGGRRPSSRHSSASASPTSAGAASS